MSTTSNIRIIAGKWRGRKLSVIASAELRPTPDRVREMLFNWMQNEIVGARCLDLFAGTGALGFEALSRGALETVLIESDQQTIAILKKHAVMLKSEEHTVEFSDGLSWLKKTTKVFDIIFLDPPFRQGYIKKCCDLIMQNSLLAQHGLVYIESEPNLPLPQGWEVKKQKLIGQVKSMLIVPT